ncbi:unnamed protein product, partial [Meganyctiphanes norvegica]
GCEKGEGYTSVLVRVDVKAVIIYEEIHEDAYDPHEIEYHVIIKFGSQDPLEKGMYDTLRFNQRELLLYTHAIDELNAFQLEKSDNEFPINIPKFVYGKYSDKNYVLVLENMKMDYFSIININNALNFEQAKAALSQLARLHAVSYVYNKDNNILKKFPCFKADEQLKNIFIMGYNFAFEFIIEYLQTKPDMKILLEKIKNAKSSIINDCKESFKEQYIPYITCLNHGDSWNNNIMVKDCANERNDNDGRYKICVIDWQLCHWDTPAYDLQNFIAGSTTPDLRSEHLDNLLQHYHVCFTEVTNKLGSPTPNWGYEQLKKEYDRLNAYGFLKKIMFSVNLSDAQKELVTGDKHGTLNPCLNNGKKILSTFLIPVLLKPFFVNAQISILFDPIKKELISEKTSHFNERVIKILLEAEKIGIFERK